jgi:hypothetical protein
MYEAVNQLETDLLKERSKKINIRFLREFSEYIEVTPTIWQNVTYMIDFSLGMYWRYFMWNFRKTR